MICREKRSPPPKTRKAMGFSNNNNNNKQIKIMDNDKLKNAITRAEEMLPTHGVQVKGGKSYLMVVHRLTILREEFGLDLGIETKVIHQDDKRCIVQALITDADCRVYGSGLAEEWRDHGNINSTSAMENAESSAIGRALASIGLHGGEYPSADEMAQAINSPRSKSKPREPLPAPASGSWADAIVPIGKNKGKTLGELTENQRKWYLEKYEANENYPESVAFREACDRCLAGDDETFQEADMQTDEVSEQTAQDSEDDEDVPF